MTEPFVLDQLEQSVRIPVIRGMYAQGDLIVVPLHLLDSVTPRADAQWRPVPPDGIEVLRGAAGGNPHALVAEPGTCRWTTDVADPTGLALGIFDADAVAYLMHPEHGATGSHPGRYVIRRQREHSEHRARYVAD
ncbi:hypothetical protein [Nocardia cyriacigeorgica]|uniref:hypothetical protein n=1 Tax=Nocardia cyriacigeorgica TaxID=135487 RepID=UPI0024572A82|nr:hypothetical protein [Nocardia cyriacigeorgica]